MFIHRFLIWAEGTFWWKPWRSINQPGHEWVLGPYFLSFLFVFREHQFNIPLGEKRERMRGLHASVTLSSPNNHSLWWWPAGHKTHIFLNTQHERTTLTAFQRPFHIMLSPQQPQQLAQNTICPKKAVTSPIRTGKHFKSQLEEHCHQGPELTPRVMSHTWTPAQWLQPWAWTNYKIIGNKVWHHDDIMEGEI